jgi:hypothetical protein
MSDDSQGTDVMVGGITGNNARMQRLLGRAEAHYRRDYGACLSGDALPVLDPLELDDPIDLLEARLTEGEELVEPRVIV